MLLATFKGTVAFGYFHPIVCMLVSVLAMYLATEPAHEVEAGLVDLELARSVPRHALITRSLVAAAIAMSVAAAMMAARHLDGPSRLRLADRSTRRRWTIVTLLIHLVGVAAVFGALGLAIAAGARRWSTAFFTAALAVVVLYLVDFLAIGWPSMRSVAWISPFHYYPALSIVAGDALDIRNLIVLFGSAAIFCVVAYWRFEHRDL